MEFSKITQFVLERRGINQEYLEQIEIDAHQKLAGIDFLCEKLHDIKESHQKIVVIPDFDMDGIMSGTVGYVGLTALGFSCDLYRPKTDKYGIFPPDIDNILEQFPDTKAIITCDTGIGCLDASQYAKSLGLSVLITDHHKEEEVSSRQVADAVVDPCGIGEAYEHPAICGAFVMWQVIDNYATMYENNETIKEAIRLLRVFAGIGTVSDVMPVLYENRKLIRDAIEISKECLLANETFKKKMTGMPNVVVNSMRGLYTVLSYLKTNNKIADIEKINEETFGFYIAPMFNSIKRMNSNTGIAFDIFTGGERTQNLLKLGDLNDQRKQEVKETFELLQSGKNELAPFIYICEARGGILGLLAMNCMSLSKMPTLVVSQGASGDYHGSGRAPDWFPFFTISQNIEGLTCKGHEGSFGCEISSDANLESICNAIAKKVEELKPDDELLEMSHVDVSLSTQDDLDFEINQDELLRFADDLESIRPFGRGFERPVVMLEFEGANSNARTIGSDASHLKMNVNNVDILCWGQGDKQEACLESDTVKVIGDVSVNEYRGMRKAQIVGELILSNLP